MDDLSTNVICSRKSGSIILNMIQIGNGTPNYYIQNRPRYSCFAFELTVGRITENKEGRQTKFIK